MEITPKPLRLNYEQGRRGHPVEAITVHIADGWEDGTWQHFNDPKVQASSHYFVCLDGRVLRFVSETDTAWTNGLVESADRSHPLIAKWLRLGVSPNLRTVSIEFEGRGGHQLTQAQRRSGRELIALIAARHGLPVSRAAVLGHYQISGTQRRNCPGFGQAVWDHLLAPAVDADDLTLERIYQLSRFALGAKRFAGLLHRPYAEGVKVLVCERGVVAAKDGLVLDIDQGMMDDLLTYWEGHGVIQRF